MIAGPVAVNGAGEARGDTGRTNTRTQPRLMSACSVASVGVGTLPT